MEIDDLQTENQIKPEDEEFRWLGYVESDCECKITGTIKRAKLSFNDEIHLSDYENLYSSNFLASTIGLVFKRKK